MPEGMNEFFWFVLGVFSYRIISGILQYGQLAVLFEQQLYHILKLLDIISKDLDNALEMKYSYIKDAGLDDDEVERRIARLGDARHPEHGTSPLRNGRTGRTDHLFPRRLQR